MIDIIFFIVGVLTGIALWFGIFLIFIWTSRVTTILEKVLWSLAVIFIPYISFFFYYLYVFSKKDRELENRNHKKRGGTLNG